MRRVMSVMMMMVVIVLFVQLYASVSFDLYVFRYVFSRLLFSFSPPFLSLFCVFFPVYSFRY